MPASPYCVTLSKYQRPSNPRSLRASGPHLASAGCAKRKQSARPPMGEGVSNKACPKPFPTLPYQPSRIPPRPSPPPSFFRLFFRLQIFLPKSFPKPFQGPSQGPQNHQKPNFFLKKPSQGPSFCPFLGRSMFLSLFGSFPGHFFMKKRHQK